MKNITTTTSSKKNPEKIKKVNNIHNKIFFVGDHKQSSISSLINGSTKIGDTPSPFFVKTTPQMFGSIVAGVNHVGVTPASAQTFNISEVKNRYAPVTGIWNAELSPSAALTLAGQPISTLHSSTFLSEREAQRKALEKQLEDDKQADKIAQKVRESSTNDIVGLLKDATKTIRDVIRNGFADPASYELLESDEIAIDNFLKKYRIPTQCGVCGEYINKTGVLRNIESIEELKQVIAAQHRGVWISCKRHHTTAYLVVGGDLFVISHERLGEAAQGREK